MFNFYELNVTTILAIFVTAIIIYSLLDNYSKNENKNIPMYAFISLFSGVVVSIMVSYLTLEPDVILTDNFWAE